MKKTTFFKTLLVTAGLLISSVNVLADETGTAIVKMTYVEQANPTKSYGEIPTGQTAEAGVNEIKNGFVEIASANYGITFITYLQVDASEIPGTITGATLTFEGSGSSADNRNRASGFGVGYNNSEWSSSMTYATADRTITTIGDIYWTKSQKSDIFENVSFNIYDALKDNANKKVTIIIYETAADHSYIKNPQVTVTYTNETVYNVTFTETNGVNATITIDGSDVTNGVVLPNAQYEFTATAAGYNDYSGNFTVNGADINVEFAMTAKVPVESVKVIYKLADGTEITSEEQENIAGLYIGETATIPFRMYVTKDGKLYQTPNNSNNPHYGDNDVELVQNVVVEKIVTEVDLKGGTLVFLKDLDDSDSNNSGVRASYESAYDNKAYTSEETLPAGIYTFIIRHYNRGRGSSIVVGETTVFTAEGNIWDTYIKNNIMVPEGGQLSLVAGSGRTIDLYDVIIAIKTGEAEVTATVTDAGWATLYTTVALDFSSVEGLTAYTATVDDEEGTVTLNEVQDVPANTGVVLEGAGEHIIPVIANATTEDKGDLVGSTTDTAWDAEAEYTYYILTANEDKNEVQFNPATSGTIAAGKAYLKLEKGTEPSKLRVVIAGEATAISSVDADKAENGATYNVAGQLVNDNYKGIVIKNGKKYLNK